MSGRRRNRGLQGLRDLVLALPAEVIERAGPRIAEVMRADVEATIAAGTTSDGQPWEPRKADGSKPLRNAAKALEVEAQSTTITLRIRGIEGRHHRGQVRGGTKRRIIPVGKMPDRMRDAVRAVLEQTFSEVARG